ncbi:helix-turn-helix transcriptional regulator [Bradyrhizobium sp. AS23.2]|uniref:helix-turn-helix transcriptional regulator n=1 Tax=Bradyrhizobium sp. AS23.2 TaxID=1680155 RepID=UPI001FD8A673|nr:helix-turn-helix transcriptional regulator [Bradyrhizobium sp. AS23.2]
MKPEQRQAASELSMLRDDNYDPQELSNVIDDVYDTVLDHSLWIGAIERAAHFVRGTGAALYSKNVANQEGSVQYVTGIDPYFTQLYFDKYVTFGPTTGGQFLAEIEQPVAVADLMSHPEFLETRVYRERVAPQGLVDCVNAVLDKSATSVAMFGVFRSERDGMVDDEARHRMRLIVPHIRRAVLIGRMFDLKAAEAATFADTLDGLSVGMCLVDAGGRIVHANAAGYAMIAVSDILRSVGGRLVACDAQVDKTLREIFAAAGQLDAALGTMGIAVPLVGKGDERYVAHVLPLTSGARRRAGRTYTAAAALFVRRAALEVPSAFEVIGKMFKLTPTELRVLLAIVEVGGVPEVAAALGVAVTTIKTHLGRLFEKTGATRQADLVKLVAGYATPLTD